MQQYFYFTSDSCGNNNRNNLEIENLLLWFACVWHRRRWHYGSFYLEWHFYLRSLFFFLLWVETVYAIEYLWVAIFIKVIDIRIYKLRLNVCFCCGADCWQGLARNGNRLKTSDELLDNLRLWLPLIHGNEIFTFGKGGIGKGGRGLCRYFEGGFIIGKSFNFMSFSIKLILRDWNPFHSRLPTALLKVNLFRRNPHFQPSLPLSFFCKRSKNLFKLFSISFTRENIGNVLLNFRWNGINRNSSNSNYSVTRHFLLVACRGWMEVMSSLMMQFPNCATHFCA